MKKRNSMAIRIILASLSLALVLAPAALRAQDSTSRFSLKLFGGGSLASGSDLNTSLEGFSQYWDYLASLSGFSKTGAFAAAHLGLEFGGDVIFQISPAFGIGLGSGFLTTSKTSQITYTNGADVIPQNIKPSFSAVPLRLGLYYTIAAGPSLNVIFNAGLGYYLAKATSDWSLTESGMPVSYVSEISANGLGFHGGLALEFKVGSGVGLFLEISGRYANLGPFTGTTTVRSGPTMISTNGTFSYFDLLFGTQRFPFALVSDASISYLNVREAKIDFSGGSLRAGIIIHL